MMCSYSVFLLGLEVCGLEAHGGCATGQLELGTPGPGQWWGQDAGRPLPGKEELQ